MPFSNFISYIGIIVLIVLVLLVVVSNIQIVQQSRANVSAAWNTSVWITERHSNTPSW